MAIKTTQNLSDFVDTDKYVDYFQFIQHPLNFVRNTELP